MSAELFALVGRLAGRAPSNVQPTQLLLSPPQQGAWSLQGLNWHVDVRAGAADPIPGIQAFFLLDDVAPRGGATLALAGSHRLGTQGMPSPASLRGVLGHSQNLVQDLQREGIALVEMSGRAGDVFLMDMRVLHTLDQFSQASAHDGDLPLPDRTDQKRVIELGELQLLCQPSEPDPVLGSRETFCS